MTVLIHNLLADLAPLRGHAGERMTVGLDDATVQRFAESHADLRDALAAAAEAYAALGDEFTDLLDLDEAEQVRRTQAGYINFYASDTVQPYVALAARGPWIVTLKGAVVHDMGGYGMVGFGHDPAPVLEALARPQVMANVMTPSLSQLRAERALRAEIGHTRGGCPFTHFLCLNSGSEAVGLAARLADINAKLQTDPGARHEGAEIKRVIVRGSFHGRTDRPALYSDSSREAYETHLASYRGESGSIVVDPYDVEQLRAAFAEAEHRGWFIEALFLEPVMGEGDPGRAVPPEFYAAARELTRDHGGLLLVDSIQAGLRAHGVLSFVDYPGYEYLEAPDMETYSKALNAAQFPLSVLAVNERTAEIYRTGVYGNTMTANPRALDVAVATLGMLDDGIRANIRRQGQRALDKLEELRATSGGAITSVQGTGLLFSCGLDPAYRCFGADSTEDWLRRQGLNVIHGGENSLRFTPHFRLTDDELDLMVELVGRALQEGPRRV